MALPIAALLPVVVEYIKAKGEDKKLAREKLKAEAVTVASKTFAQSPVTTGIGAAMGVSALVVDPVTLQATFPQLTDAWALGVSVAMYATSLLFLFIGKKVKK